MKRTLCVVSCAALVLAVMSGVASAATISYTTSIAGASVGPVSSWDTAFGAGGQSIFWDISSGRPNYNGAVSNTVNPAYVQSFTYQNTVAGGGNSGIGGNSSYTANGYGGGPGTTGVNYDLKMNENMTFYFTALFYDSTYGADNGGLDPGATALEVRLIDPSAAASTDEAWHAISVAQLEGGAFEQWFVTATAGDKIETQVEWVNGEGVGAAGFFLDNVTPKAGTANPASDPPTTPEPATTGLLGLGLASLVAWRKKRFGSRHDDRRASDLSRLADI